MLYYPLLFFNYNMAMLGVIFPIYFCPLQAKFYSMFIMRHQTLQTQVLFTTSFFNTKKTTNELVNAFMNVVERIRGDC